MVDVNDKEKITTKEGTENDGSAEMMVCL